LFAFVYNIMGIPVAAGALRGGIGCCSTDDRCCGDGAVLAFGGGERQPASRVPSCSLPAEDETTDRVDVEVHQHQGHKEDVMATVKDPVCGMEIDPATAAASEEYEGKTYYFCSEGCHQRFVAAPAQYAA
jgi:Cu+-exporting ATPase